VHRAADARLVGEEERAAVFAELVNPGVRTFAVGIAELKALRESAGLAGQRLDVVDRVAVA